MSKFALRFSSHAWSDYCYWQDQKERKTLARINSLIKDIQRHPYSGIGKLEPLKHALSGAWSRRIDSQHRLVYEVTNDEIRIYQCRFHY